MYSDVAMSLLTFPCRERDLSALGEGLRVALLYLARESAEKKGVARAMRSLAQPHTQLPLYRVIAHCAE